MGQVGAPVRVGFLTHYFPPEVGAPQTRIQLLAHALAESGAQVTVHTGFPHYPNGILPPPYRNRPWSVEEHDAVRVVRSAVYPAANRGFTRRLLDHAAFAASALATAWLTGPLDVLVAESPPLFTAAAGALYAQGKRAAYVVHVADRWPASAVELGMLRNRRAILAAEGLERWVYRSADLIAAPTEGIVTSLGRLPAAAGRARRVWPVVDIDRFAVEIGCPRRPADATLRLLYAGTVGLAQGLEALVEASHLAGPEVVDTTIVGDGAERPRLEAIVHDRQVPNVRLLGSVAAARIPELLRDADAVAVLLRDVPLFAGALPTKLLEAMAASRPVLLAARGEAARFVGQAGAGVVVPPGDPAALAGAIRDLQANPGQRSALGLAGRSYVEAHFGKHRAAAQWSALLSDALAARRSRSQGPARRSEGAAAGRCQGG